MRQSLLSLPRRLFLIKGAALLALVRGAAQTRDEPSWLWTGAVTPSSATVLVRFASLAGPVPALLVAPRRDLSDARTVQGRAVKAPSRGNSGRVVVEYAVTDLTPDTEYFAGLRAESGTRVRFRTFGATAYSFTAAFASCAGGTRLVPLSHVSNSGVFAAINALDPHVFIHMGDLHYYNILAPARPLDLLLGLFRQAIDRVLAQEMQALLYRSTPIVYMWDDHDYGPDESESDSPTRDAARACYATDVPHYALPLAPNADGPIAQAFDIGRVRFLVTDARSERKTDARTLLGPAQLGWLLAELEKAAAQAVPLVVWVNPVPWITSDGDMDGWGRFTDERRRIGERITALELSSRLLMLSGDAHMLAFDDGRNNTHGGFVVAQASPLDRFVRRKGGPYSHEPPNQQNGQFGTLRVEDNGETLTATVQGHRYTGEGRSALVPITRLQLVCTGERCELQPVETRQGPAR